MIPMINVSRNNFSNFRGLTSFLASQNGDKLLRQMINANTENINHLGMNVSINKELQKFQSDLITT